MKTLFTKLKLFYAHSTVQYIVIVLVGLTFVASYCFLWVKQTWLMALAHISVMLFIWAFTEALALAEKEYDDVSD